MPKISRGCNTCRRRKKSCDLKTPSCGQCLKLGIYCAGYTRPVKFVTVAQAGKSPPLSPGRLGNRVNKPRTVPPSNDRAVTQSSVAILPRQPKTPSSWIIPFWAIIPPPAHQTSATSKDSPFTGWVSMSLALNSSDETLQKALMALSLSALGRSSNTSHLLHEGRYCYSEALTSLHETIAHDMNSLNGESLAGIMLLSLYEVVEGSPMRGLGWTSHTDAAVHLMRKRGRTWKSSELTKKLFVGLRVFATIRAISLRTPTFLSTPEWNALPWIEDPRATDYTQLLTIMSKIPSLLANIDSIKGCGVQELPHVHDVSRECHSLIKSLRWWYRSFQGKYGDKTHWDEPSNLSMRDVEWFKSIIFLNCISFSDFDVAQLKLLYWAAQLIISNNLWLAYKVLETRGFRLPAEINRFENETTPNRRGPRHTDELSQLPALSLTLAETYIYSTNIARSLEFFLKAAPNAVVMAGIVFPATVAMGFFQYFNLPELAWCKMVFNRMKTTSGINLEGFIEAVAEESGSTLVG